jgi:hypothetical protein
MEVNNGARAEGQVSGADCAAAYFLYQKFQFFLRA